MAAFYTRKVGSLPFLFGQPNDYDNNQDCITMLRNGLDDEFCDSNKRFICEATGFLLHTYLT